MTARPLPDRSRAVAVWLFLTAILVFAMVVVGGATRLTGSGLSITQWKPVTGALPPMTHADWLKLFDQYRATTQYAYVNRGMSLDAFQGIYWWEWSHRLLGRAIGFVFAVPLLVFLALRRIPRRLIWRCLVAFALGGLQGLVGWWMVKSGLAGRVAVAPERLSVHLGLALFIFCFLIWTGFEAWAGSGRPSRLRGIKTAAAGLVALVFVQIMLGGLVAGNDAGLVDTDWPLMNGRVFPSDYVSSAGWAASLMHSQAAVQFNHRIGAYLLLIGAGLTAFALRRSAAAPRRAVILGALLAGLVVLQAALGIVTLINQAPLHLALAHQCLAAVVLATALALSWRTRRA